jgi:hypothetical protein
MYKSVFAVVVSKMKEITTILRNFVQVDMHYSTVCCLVVIFTLIGMS